MSSETLAFGQPGWFGKLPAIGDFLRHELPDDFVAPWDDWLRQGMAAGAQRAGDDWQDTFLRFPVWHFLRKGTAAGTPCIWSGLLVPGADRVGRLFPFTVAFPVPEPVLLAAGTACVEQCLDLIASHVLAVLGDDDLDGFTQNMATVDLSAGSGTPASGDCATPSALAARLGREALLGRLAGGTLFWTGDPSVPLVLAGEPLDADAFCQLVLSSSLPIAVE